MRRPFKYWLIIVAGRRLIGCLLLAGLCAPLAGCWDLRELQNRHMALAVAIDVADGKEAVTETFIQPYGGKQFRLSVELLEIAPSQGEQRSGSGNKTYVITNTGRAFFEIIRDMLGQVGRTISFDHLQAVVISEAAIEAGGLDQLLDWFMRNAEMRWRIHVYVTPGEAKPLLEYQPPSGEANGIFLANIVRNNVKDPHITSARSDLGFTVEKMDNRASLVLPKIELIDGVVKVGGAACIKQNRLAGYLNEDEIVGAKFILGVEKSAIITIRCQDHPERIMAFELFRHDTRLQAHVSGSDIYYTLDIAMYGNIGEMGGCPEPNDHDTASPDYLHKLENQFAEEVKQRVLRGLKVQQDMGMDFTNFGRTLSIQYPKKWKEIKSRWEDEFFPTVPLIVSVNVKILQLGEHK